MAYVEEVNGILQGWNVKIGDGDSDCTKITGFSTCSCNTYRAKAYAGNECATI